MTEFTATQTTTSWYNYVDNMRAENEGRARQAASASAHGGSYLVALATILGQIADQMTENLISLAKGLDDLQAQKKDDPKGDHEWKGMSENELTAHMQAQTQLLSMFMQAMNTIIKTFGESNKDVARKQ